MKKIALVLFGALVASVMLMAPTPANAATGSGSDEYVSASGTADNVTLKPDACGYYGRLIANVTRVAPGWTIDQGSSWWSADIYTPSNDWTYATADLGSSDKVSFCYPEFGTHRADFEVNYWLDGPDGAAVFETVKFTTTFTVNRQKASASVTRYGSVTKATNRSWKIAGKLARTGDSTYGGQSIRLQRYVNGGWSTYRSCTTGTAGTCAVTAPTTSRTTYRWYYAGNSSVNADASGSFTLAARPTPYTTTVSKYGAATKAANRSWKVTGKLSRSGDSTYQGQTIKLQKKSGTKWVTVQTCKTGSTGRCAVVRRNTIRTTYRWFYAGNVDAKSDVSGSFTLAKRY